jgi:hypothetical protein
MPRSITHRRRLSSNPIAWGLAIVASTAFAFLPAVDAAQSKSKKGSADHEKKTGKVAEVEKKGKACTIKVAEADGETFDLNVAAKTRFVVNGKGDSGFFKYPRAFVSSKSVFLNSANGQFFGKKFTIHLGKEPAAMFEPEENNPEVYHIAGEIVNCDASSFTINSNGTVQKVNFEQGADETVDIESTDPDHALVGSEVEVEGTTKGGKFIPLNIVVTLDKPLVADEVMAASEKKPGKAKPTSKTPKKTAKTDKGDAGDKEDTAENGDENPAGKPLQPASDPFEVKKKDPKKKTPAKAKPKKPVDPDSDS